jgi:hypothetical protein
MTKFLHTWICAVCGVCVVCVVGLSLLPVFLRRGVPERKIAFKMRIGGVVDLGGNTVNSRVFDFTVPDAIVDGYYVWYQDEHK